MFYHIIQMVQETGTENILDYLETTPKAIFADLYRHDLYQRPEFSRVTACKRAEGLTKLTAV